MGEAEEDEEAALVAAGRWRLARAPGKTSYYYHLDTRETRWTKPDSRPEKESQAEAASEKPKDAKQDASVVVRRLLSFAAEDKLLVWVGAACVLLSSAFDTAIPNYSARALALIISENMAGGGDAGAWTPRTFRGAFHGLVVFALLSAATTAARVGCSALVEVRLISRVQQRLYASILSQELAFFDATSSGYVLAELPPAPAPAHLCS